MQDIALYAKIVAWSDAAACCVGQCPGMIGPCCHGDDEAHVSTMLAGGESRQYVPRLMHASRLHVGLDGSKPGMPGHRGAQGEEHLHVRGGHPGEDHTGVRHRGRPRL